MWIRTPFGNVFGENAVVVAGLGTSIERGGGMSDCRDRPLLMSAE